MTFSQGEFGSPENPRLIRLLYFTNDFRRAPFLVNGEPEGEPLKVGFWGDEKKGKITFH